MDREDARTHVDRRALLRAFGLGVAASAYAACSEQQTHDGEARDAGSPEPSTDAGLAQGARDARVADGSGPAMASGGDAGTRDAARATDPSDLEAGVARPRDLIDFHAHFLPPGYAEAATAAGQTPDGGSAWPSWSFDDHQRLMDQAGIAVSVLSISSPGVHFGDDAAAVSLATRVNDQAAALIARAPDQLRFLASLPLPNVDGAIAEWRRVRTMPGCIGAVVMSNSRGVYPGDKSFDALWTELNASPAFVLVHPTAPPDVNLVSSSEPSATMEIYFESVRACMSMFESSVVTRFSNIHFVIPHCGGALPVMLDRIRTFGLGGYALDPSVTSSQHSGLWFDCAGTPLPTQLPALLQQTTLDRVLYGSENCFTPSSSVLAQIADLDQQDEASGAPFRAALVKNGKGLLPT